jgi:hypothetical protein
MVRSTATSVHDETRYQCPAVTGLADILDRQVSDRPGARALVVTADRIEVSYRNVTAASHWSRG